MKEKIIRYEEIAKDAPPIVHVIQHIPGTAEGRTTPFITCHLSAPIA